MKGRYEMKASKMMRRVFLAVAVGSLVLSAPVAAQDANVAEAKNRLHKFKKLISRLKSYSTQKTYSSGYIDGAEDQREIDRLNNQYEITRKKLHDKEMEEIKQLGDECKRRIEATTNADEANRLCNECKKAANLLDAKQRQKRDQQLGEIIEDMRIVNDAQKLNFMKYEYKSRMEAAPYKAEQLQREFVRKSDAYLKERGYVE
jgi:hypothetical protein